MTELVTSSNNFTVRLIFSISMVIIIVWIFLEIFVFRSFVSESSVKSVGSFVSGTSKLFSKWFVSLMLTILTYMILELYKLGNIELLEKLSLLFMLQSLVYIVSSVTISQLVDLNNEVPQGIFRIVIAGIFVILWASFRSSIWRSELRYMIVIPVSISFILFILTNFLKLIKQEIPQNDYSTNIVDVLHWYNSTPLQLIINIHLWCSTVYLFYEMLL